MPQYGYTTIDYFADNSFLKSPGFLRPSRFKIEWTSLPDVISSNLTILTQNVSTVVTPGFSVETAPAPFRIAIGRRRIETISVTFFESSNLDIKQTMYKWIDFVATNESDTENFERNYPDEFTCTLRVSPLNNAGAITMSEVFTYVFPTGITESTYDIGQDAEVGKITATFAYRYHEVKTGS